MKKRDNTARDQQPNDEEKLAAGVIALVKKLFHDHYCPQYEITLADKGRVTFTAFSLWLDETIETFSGEELCSELKIDAGCWELLRNLQDREILGHRLQQYWYPIILNDRPPPAPRIKSINSAMIVTYEDGTIANVQSFATPEIMPAMANHTSVDGFIATMLEEHGRSMGRLVAEASLQGLYNQARQHVFRSPEGYPDPYEVFCGMVLEHLPRVNVAVRPSVENYLTLFRTLVRPIIPPEVLAKYAQVREAVQPDEARGGIG